jgi:hypothetical protein
MTHEEIHFVNKPKNARLFWTNFYVLFHLQVTKKEHFKNKKNWIWFVVMRNKKK